MGKLGRELADIIEEDMNAFLISTEEAKELMLELMAERGMMVETADAKVGYDTLNFC
jgi:hypothetical protein